MSRQFQRTIENFECAQCGFAVDGDGYTNHCPRCLWSRHVDENPGDRKADCGGMMRPVAITGKPGEYRIKHRCEACGIERWNRSHAQDDFDAVLALAKSQADPGVQ
ncbi:MAG: RNHCP domain-containing protein [Chloroflexi bacterium]|nr:RNHCP domain-containing protein [Chloroflexota bacterium]